MITRDTYQKYASAYHPTVWDGSAKGYVKADHKVGKDLMTVTDTRVFGVLIFRHRKHHKEPTT